MAGDGVKRSQQFQIQGTHCRDHSRFLMLCRAKRKLCQATRSSTLGATLAN
jgi:hypothetical protein